MVVFKRGFQGETRNPPEPFFLLFVTFSSFDGTKEEKVNPRPPCMAGTLPPVRWNPYTPAVVQAQDKICFLHDTKLSFFS